MQGLPTPDAKRAVEIAREFLTSAGLAFSIVTKVEESQEAFVIHAEALSRRFQMRVRKSSGTVEGFQELAPSR